MSIFDIINLTMIIALAVLMALQDRRVTLVRDRVDYTEQSIMVLFKKFGKTVDKPRSS